MTEVAVFDKAAALAALERHPFHAPNWIRDRHLQTCWGPFFRRQQAPESRLERWATPDDDFLRVWLSRGREDAPWVVLLHGLEGDANSHYIVGMRVKLAALGWSVATMEFRGCGGEMNRARRMYHSGETTDLAFLVSTLRERFSPGRLYLAGFSLGGNQIGKWLGEESESVASLVDGAALVSPPFDLTVSGPVLDSQLFGLYTKRFLRTLIPKAVEKERQFPGCLDVEAIRRCTTFAEFDTLGTAALHGFRDNEDYWRSVGCGQFLDGVRVPTLLVAAADDPFNPGSTIPRRLASASPWLVPRFTERGGHVGFVYGTPWHTRHWAEEEIVSFFQHLEAIAARR
jgi:predicted alpha/beta-fold hydrolase